VGVTAAVIAILALFLMPLGYGVATALKSPEQAASPEFRILPLSPAQWEHDGQKLELYQVPQADGSKKSLAMVQKGRQLSTFVDPASPQAPPVEWKGNWRTLTPELKVDPQWSNFLTAWTSLDFVVLLRNTLFYAGVSTIGILLSSSFVAYGFSRFRFKGRGVAFGLVMATMILPNMITLIPTYAFFFSIGWIGTWLPLLVPAFFSNAFNVFLLRQFFMGIPRELDEAAKIDGAGPIRTLYQVILPQAVPALVAAGLFNFFYCWNDYFLPLVYLAGHPDLYPISVGLSAFSTQYVIYPYLVQAASILASLLPIVLFFFTRRFFMEGVILAGVDK
jgi:multiple sugar transport system permease protein